MSVLCVHDYFLTLPREVAYIWQRKLSIASWLFLVNRYATLYFSVSGAMEVVIWDPHKVNMANQVSSV